MISGSLVRGQWGQWLVDLTKSKIIIEPVDWDLKPYSINLKMILVEKHLKRQAK